MAQIKKTDLISFGDLCLLAQQGLQTFLNFPRDISKIIAAYAIWNKDVSELQIRTDSMACVGALRWKCIALFPEEVSISDLTSVLLQNFSNCDGLDCGEEAQHQFWVSMTHWDGRWKYVCSNAKKFPKASQFFVECNRRDRDEANEESDQEEEEIENEGINMAHFISPLEMEELYQDFDDFFEKVQQYLPNDWEIRLVSRNPYSD
jgi:hypothetical protein